MPRPDRPHSLRRFWLPVSAAALLLAPAAAAVNIDWVTVGDPGNACDPQSQGCFGAVSYTYQVSKYEITNTEYAEFLNVMAAADPNSLYDSRMSSSMHGGITQSGSDGTYSYALKAGFENKPVNFVSLYDAMRFANWLGNGQPSGAQGPSTTETGAYTITDSGIQNNTITRNFDDANIALTSENEWYKAAYYNALSNTYFDYPTGTNAPTGCAAPTTSPNSANCGPVVGTVTDVGAYPGSASPYGTFDQGGNLWEWNETILAGQGRVVRGGAWTGNGNYGLQASDQSIGGPAYASDIHIGFRVAIVPEPSTGLLVMSGLLGLAYRQRRHGRAA